MTGSRVIRIDDKRRTKETILGKWKSRRWKQTDSFRIDQSNWEQRIIYHRLCILTLVSIKV